jgi:pyruvate,water dikinase
MNAFFGWVKETFSHGNRALGRASFATLFGLFQKILTLNNQVLDLIAGMGTKLGGNYVFDRQYIRSSCDQLADLIYKLIYNLNAMAPRKYLALYDVFREINQEIEEELAGRLVIPRTDYTMPYRSISRDFGDVVGAKNANLAEVKNLLGLAVPEGFAITTRAFQSFLQHNGFQERIPASTTAWQRGEISTEKAETRIRDLILSGSIPPALAKAVQNATEDLYREAGDGETFLALRSSARGEDTEMSFAGQYVSLLNVPPEQVLDSYKAVVAGTYAASAMEYRRQKGFAESEVAMAVGCQLMVDAKVSGVLYTLDPRSPEREVMVLTSSWGLGAPVVAGEVKADQYAVERKPPHAVTAMDIVRKEKRLAPREGGGTEFCSVDGDLQTGTSLRDDQIRLIAEAGLIIERHFKRPQDIEWALDQKDGLLILQARPLNIKAQVAQMVCDISSRLKTYPIIFENKGAVAQEGIGAGKVFVMKSEEDLDAFPPGAVLVSRYTSPRLAKVMRKANAVITDVGSPTGHMATIAREFHVPAIVNTGIATEVLQTGQEVTVDARQNIVYSGTVKELCYYEFTEEAFEEMYEYRLLRRVLKKIAPLNLLDPSDKDFVPTACKTFHDITRFVHEKAVQHLINLEYSHVQRSQTSGRKLKFDVPLALVLIDIGGGIAESSDSDTVTPGDILSLPMRAFLEGLALPGAWNTEPVSVDFGGFMSSLTRTFSFKVASPQNVGQNLAVISKEYANISLRLGYHFNMIDAYVSENTNDNYAYFRFLGGVTDMTRRSRRARLMADILAANDFRTDVRGDLVVARIKKLDIMGMEKKMRLLGLLVAYTRQLDIKMLSEHEMKKSFEDFKGLKKAHSASAGF